MDRNEFRLFLRRYAENRCTKEEMELVDRWYELIGDEETLSSVREEEWDQIEDRLWNKIQEDRQPVRRRLPWYRWAAAAAVAGGIIATAIYFGGRRTGADKLYAQAGNGDYREQVNNTAASSKLTLEDGSVVTLYPGAALKYPHHFRGGAREVYLKGKAFFDVGKDATRPFYVYSTNLVTHVLGTSFTINPAADGNQVEVSVRSGRVEVYEQGTASARTRQRSSSGVILTPNQKVIYRQAESSFETTLVESPQPVMQHGDTLAALPQLVFNDESLRGVVASLESLYGVEIVFENDSLPNCPFTGGLTQTDLYAKLDVLCQSVGASYEIKGTKILIRGKGCI